MKYGICTLSIVPFRKEAAHRSEMVSQILFGEWFEILEESREWTLVRTCSDSYMGWIQNGQFRTVDEAEMEEYRHQGPPVTVGSLGGKLWGDTHCFDIYHGTVLYLQAGSRCDFKGISLKFEGDLSTYVRSDFPTSIAELAKKYKDVPYLWGGRSRAGIDCSGFTQLIYKSFQIDLPRDAWQQAELGEPVDFVSEVEPGDLAFFDNEEGRITHVGIMLDTQTIIHASAKVRIDRMDTEGIFSPELNRYSHRLRIIKRY